MLNTCRLHLSGWIWSGLLVANCAQASPALGVQATTLRFRVDSPPSSVSPSAARSIASSSHLSPDSLAGYQMAQTVSAAQPSAPTLWASQSLARLIDQHDCTSQNSAAESRMDDEIGDVNRYKLATLLFSCLEHWDRQSFDVQDQAALNALRSEFKLELVALRGHSVSDPMLASANIPRESIGSNLGFQTSDSVATVSVAEYSQSISVASKGRVAMGVHYTDRATGSFQTLLGINAEASLGKFGLFGRYSAALGSKFSPADRNADDLLSDRSIQSWTAGIGIRDFIIPRSVLTVSVNRSIPPSNLSQSAQTNYGAFYQFPLTERLTLSPSLVIMTQSENNGATSDVQGALQASFSF